MQFDWDPQRAEWPDHNQQQMASAALPLSATSFAQRRRSSAAHIRPAAPPPTLPIPSVPSSSLASSADSQDLMNGRNTRSNSFNRPGPSASLAAVASFSVRQSSSAPTSQSLLHAVSEADDVDPPPYSFYSSSRMSDRPHDTNPNRHLSPPTIEQRPSSRRALTRALELAREAVQLDSTNDNPEAAVYAYAQSVALLSEVMERVKRGEDSTESRRGRRRRSVAAQEEEVRRLQNIHDTYADRMNILSIIYSIPVPYSTASLYSISRSSSSAQATSPTLSRFPSSEHSPQIPQVPHINSLNQLQDEAQYANDYPGTDFSQPVGAAITLNEEVLNSIPGLPPISSQHHPYASQNPAPVSQQSQSTSNPPTRNGTLHRRGRASQLPPSLPPPANSLPPAPVLINNDLPTDTSRSQTTNWSEFSARSQPPPEYPGPPRSGLTTLQEESDEGRIHLSRPPDGSYVQPLDTPRNPKRNSHPLPPLPSPTQASDPPGTPRTSTFVPKPAVSPRLSSRQSEVPVEPATTASQPVTLINSTMTQSALYLSRKTKPSRSASPTDSNVSSGSTPAQKEPQPPVPAIPPLTIHGGRSRSSSQPGRRPSIVNSQAEQRPPLPPSAGSLGSNIPSNRKPSLPSKLVPLSSVVTTAQQKELMSPQISTPTPSFTAPAIALGIMPFVPASPQPPPPPGDPLRQPYYMMNLLATSMTSPSGGYITRRLHVPNEVWTLYGVKLSNLAEKIRVLDILSAALEDLQITSSEIFGAGNVSSGMAMGIGSIGGKEASAWLAKLDEFSNMCDGVVANFGKKLGVGEGFVLKKTTWGDKLSRRFDKFTNAKNIDSPIVYMQNLRKLFNRVQLLDEHSKAVWSQPIAPAYTAFPTDTRGSTEQKLKRASEFFASVVLTFVIRDMALLLDKYVKKCQKILED